MEVFGSKAAIGASTVETWSNSTSSGAMLKKHLSEEEGSGADPGDTHFYWTTSRNKRGTGIATAGLVSSENRGFNISWEGGGASLVAGEPSCTTMDTLKSNYLNMAGGKRPANAGCSGERPLSSEIFGSWGSTSPRSGGQLPWEGAGDPRSRKDNRSSW